MPCQARFWIRFSLPPPLPACGGGRGLWVSSVTLSWPSTPRSPVAPSGLRGTREGRVICPQCVWTLSAKIGSNCKIRLCLGVNGVRGDPRGKLDELHAVRVFLLDGKDAKVGDHHVN